MPSSTITTEAAGTWRLGDLTVHRIGLGAMRLTGSEVFDRGEPSDRERSVRVLRRAVELGVDHIDTAAFYFSALRSANELINRALAPYPDGLVIATKVGPSRDASGAWLPPAGPRELRGQVEENLRQLGRDHLDLVSLRVQGDGPPVAENFGALAELRDAGLIRNLGVSGVTAAQLEQARTVAPVVSVQNRFGYERREHTGILRECGRLGIAFVPYFAVAGLGGHAGPAKPVNDRIRRVAKTHGASAAQVLLAWTLHQGPHVLAIPGTGDPAHLEANVAAGALRLTPKQAAQLDAPPDEPKKPAKRKPPVQRHSVILL
ncbi:MAG TPA: aldo/keto reductase [Actinocrinis sp.]|jgi:aryl-alcohol dehydrogenase-like predicted oxidoreductase